MSRNEAFVLNPEASTLDLEDAFSERFAQIEAMAVVMSGEDFPTWSDEIKNNSVWALRSKIEELGILFKAIRPQWKEAQS